MVGSNKIFFDFIIPLIPSNFNWVELGSWTGKSASYCVVELVNLNKTGKFYCVDSWEGGEEHTDINIVKNKELKNIFLNNIKPIDKYIIPVQSISWDAALNFNDNSLDFCYVDAGHTYECVKNDIAAWWPKIKPGSYFGGDDYTKGWPGVQKAVQEFGKENNLKIKKMGRCWYVQKPI
jgi:hypothetical protein